MLSNIAPSREWATNILCIEAEPVARALLTEALIGYDVVFAATGYDAMREVNLRAYDAYVLDYWIPGWSGLGLCRHVRNEDPTVPIIFCAAASGDSRARAVRAGASAYFPKPIDPPQLRRQLRTLLELAELSSKRAHVDARRAIDDELSERAADAMARAGMAQLSAARAIIERTARAKALAEYLKAGGTLAYFNAAWQPTFSTAWARYDPPSAPPSAGVDASTP